MSKNNFSYFVFNEINHAYLESIIFLDQAYMDRCWEMKTWSSVISLDSSRVLLCTFKGEVVGFALFSLDPFCECPHLLKVAVRPSFRRMGVAQGIMRHATFFFSLYGSTRIILDVDTKNTPAINLYKSLGFEVIHLRKRYYSDGADSFLLGLSI